VWFKKKEKELEPKGRVIPKGKVNNYLVKKDGTIIEWITGIRGGSTEAQHLMVSYRDSDSNRRATCWIRKDDIDRIVGMGLLH